MAKKYRVTVEFEVREFTCSAKNITEAKRKIMARLKKIPAARFVERKKTDVAEY